MAKVAYDTSRELKELFNRHFERWKKTHQAGLQELARRCGVSSSYMNHVSRYGRIPGKPVLILIALNFELPDPQQLFDAARINEGWPFDPELGLRRGSARDTGFLNIQVDMDGFTDTIRSIITQELRPKTISDLTRGRPLRFGISHYQHWLFKDAGDTAATEGHGFFHELCEMLAMTLRCKIDTRLVERSEYRELLRAGEIDVYGPIISSPDSLNHSLTEPFCHLGMSALVRKSPCPNLPELPVPERVEDLLNRDYKLCVLRNTRGHMFVNTRLNRSDDDIVICDTLEEAVERLTMASIARPAHVCIFNSVSAITEQQKLPKALAVAFASRDSVIKMTSNCLEVRPDWTELIPVLNQSISYLIRTGTLGERLKKYIPASAEEVVRIPSAQNPSFASAA